MSPAAIALLVYAAIVTGLLVWLGWACETAPEAKE